MKKVFTTISLSLLITGFSLGQANFKVGGLGRGEVHSTYLDKGDTLNQDVNQQGTVYFDLGINGTLNKKIGVETIVRLSNNLSSFDIDQSFITLRQIKLFGEFSKAANYELGDLDYQMTNYTLFNSEAEAWANEITSFDVYRQFSHYENFNNGNLWRQQGAKLFGNVSNSIFADSIEYQLLFSRLRASDGVTQPDEFMGGGQISLPLTDKLDLGINFIDFFSTSSSLGVDMQQYNYVGTGSIGYELGKGKIQFEGGMSKLFIEDTVGTSNIDNDGAFFDLGYTTKLVNDKLTAGISIRSVSDGFFSPGAQSKRIDYSQNPSELPVVTNSAINREVSILDIIHDESVYNRTISRQLNAFNPKFGVSTPYGRATPNRRGVSLDLSYSDSSKKYVIESNSEFLQDVTGEGTTLKHTYVKSRLGLTLNTEKLLNWEKPFVIKGGVMYDQATRPDVLVERTNLKSMIIDAGIDVTFINNLSLIVGYKLLNANGVDYIAVRDNGNTVTSFLKYDLDLSESIFAAGLKFDFTENSYLTGQFQSFNLTDNKSSLNDYSFNQFYLLFTTKL